MPDGEVKELVNKETRICCSPVQESITPLDHWTAVKIGMKKATVQRDSLERYQRDRLYDTIRFAVANSSFYRRRFGESVAGGIDSLADVTALPFTTAEDLREHGAEMLCVSQSQISRVVTLNTSGTLGEPKRLWFTAEDQMLTMDFFRIGMSDLVGKGDKVLILLPGERPGSVGDLLARALAGMGVGAIVHGIVQDLDEALRAAHDEKVDSIVGIPVQVLALARYSILSGQNPLNVKSVLLSTDFAAKSLVREVERIWKCRVFDHYGMTEMGLGGGVECTAHAGYHLREADLYFEIIDPDTGKPVPDGHEGEIVFSTLTRRGMPLIRYRTGDFSRFLPELCSCGSVLKRLDKIGCHEESGLWLPTGDKVHLAEFDEALFPVQGILDFLINTEETCRGLKIVLSIQSIRKDIKTEEEIMQKIFEISKLASALRSGDLELTLDVAKYDGKLPQGPVKRTIRKVIGTGKL